MITFALNGNIKQRNSSIELLKIIGMICIVFCHSIPTERIEYHYATTDFWLFCIMMFRQLGSIGNALFLVSSTWYLVDNDSFNVRKMKSIVADNQVISLFFLCAFIVLNIDLNIFQIINQIFPFFSHSLWYITCYVLYYCLHGYVNKALRHTNSNNCIALIFLIILVVYCFVFGGQYFSELVCFIIVHAFTWHCKRLLFSKQSARQKRIGIELLVSGIIIWFLGAIIFNFLGTIDEIIGRYYYIWNRFFNPCILMIAYGGVILVSKKQFYSKLINYISACSLFVYMITGNQLLRIYADNTLYDYICCFFGNTMKVCCVFVIAYSFIKLIIGLLFSMIYKKTIARLTIRVVEKECDIFYALLEKFR